MLLTPQYIFDNFIPIIISITAILLAVIFKEMRSVLLPIATTIILFFYLQSSHS
jgi:hypothetical protein